MSTMRDEIDAAIEHVESNADEPIEVAGVEEATEEETPAQVPGVGEETEAPEAQAPEVESPEAGGVESADTAEQGPPAAGDDKGISTPAPAGWSPQQREEWSKIPPNIQKHINDRETEIAQHMEHTSTARKTHDRMAQLGQSFAPVLAAEGVSDPLQAVEGLFNTVAQLRMGTAEQKAQTVAGLIDHYGIDITTLDNALVGSQTPAPNAEMERLLDQRMAPVNQLMQQLQQAEQSQQQATVQQAQQTVDQFAPNAEFLNDVRHDMADLIDLAAKRGQKMEIKEAYDKACALNPQVSQVIDQRKQQEALTGRTAALQGKQLAASSLNGRRGGTPSSGGPMSMREQLNSAWDEANGG